MNKIDLNDVTFIIPVRIDSDERLENLLLVIEFIKNHFNTTILVLEADVNEQVQHIKIDRKIFIEDHDSVFHRTKYLNQMTIESDTKFLAIWDTDVLPVHTQIVESVILLRQNKAEMVFPYDGRFYKAPGIIKNMYKVKRDFNVITKNQGKFGLYYRHYFVGGAFIVNRKSYIESGMENENFYGWGSEDEERVKRWEILGYRIERVEGPMFHLYHPRKKNSWFGSKELEIRNRGELLKICKMNNSELKKYVNSFEWISETNKLNQ